VNFAFTTEQSELYERVVAYARGRLNPLLAREVGLTASLFRACGELGLLGLSVPREHGGLGLDALSTAIALEAFGYACDDMGLVFSVAAQLLSVSTAIAENGTAAQKEKYLAPLCRGELVAGNAMTEAGAGSDAFALATSAAKSGDVFVVSGTKSYVTNGSAADLFLVYARTHEDGSRPLADLFRLLRGLPRPRRAARGARRSRGFRLRALDDVGARVSLRGVRRPRPAPARGDDGARARAQTVSST
jgi:alkylation response protein AidB-like acyl-CoA dehydrogenase